MSNSEDLLNQQYRTYNYGVRRPALIRAIPTLSSEIASRRRQTKPELSFSAGANRQSERSFWLYLPTPQGESAMVHHLSGCDIAFELELAGPCPEPSKKTRSRDHLHKMRLV